MRDEEVKAMFAALDGEPRPQFLATLRERLEHEWPDTGAVRPLAGEQHLPPTDIDAGDMMAIRDALADVDQDTNRLGVGCMPSASWPPHRWSSC